MANFSFTHDDLSKADEGRVFNGGSAGRATNCSAFIEQAGKNGVPENTNPNAPEFRLIFEDENGAKVNKALFPIKEEEYPMFNMTYGDAIKKEWAYLNKIVEHTGGTPVMDFDNDTDLYTKCAAAIGKDKLNVFVAYGTTRSAKQYLEPRKYLPAVEPASTPEADSKLTATRLDNLEAPSVSTEEEVQDSFFN